jgi:uncharacterized protein YciI
MTFLVIAKDGTDPDAPARRQRVRAQHLRELEPLVQSRQIRLGGAILDDAGTMIGSALLAEFENREALDEYLRSDIYTREGVWQRFEVYPFKRAV